MVEYPRKGAWALGFSAGELVLEGKKLISVFVPSTPTPFTGFVVNYPPEEVQPLNISVEEGVKFIVSGGIVAPETLRSSENVLARPAGRIS
jgi:uncharacterized membrane protein